MFHILKKFKHIKENKTVFNGFLFTVFAFMSSGVNFILLVVMSKFLSPSEYGYLNLFNTFITLMTIFVSLNMEKIIVVNFFKVPKEHTIGTISGILAMSLVLTLIYCLIILCFRNRLEQSMGFSVVYLCIATVYCLLNLISSINLSIWKAEENPKCFGGYSLSVVFFNCLITILLIVCFQQGWTSRVMAQFSVSVVFGILGFYILIKKKFVKYGVLPKLVYLKEALMFGVPLVPNTLSWWAMQGVNRFIINSYYGAAEVGLYSFATNFSNIIQMIGTAFVQSWHVDVYKTLTEKKEGYIEYLSKFTRKMMLVYLCITIVIYVGCRFLIPLIFPNYDNSIKFLLPLCIGAWSHCVNQLFVCYLFYFKKTKLLMNITIVISFLNVLLGLIFIKYNLLMAAYISMISEMLIAIMYIIYTHKLIRLNVFSR